MSMVNQGSHNFLKIQQWFATKEIKYKFFCCFRR